jgi:amidase
MKPAASAFCQDTVTLAPTGTGPLTGMRFGLKDVFDVAGRITGCGNPDWRRTHAAASVHSTVLQQLLAAGATLAGITITDELAYSINGENWHEGTPPNPRAPGRIPGGSSAGSASAVAADLVDFAIGTDCGGSIRIPASFCGLYGMRPTHGSVGVDGLVPLAPSFDTVGWFAGNADTLRRVGAVLLGPVESAASAESPASPSAALHAPHAPHTPHTLLIADDLFEQLGAPERAALRPALERLQAGFTDVVHVRIGDPDGDALLPAFRTLQAAEIWARHGAHEVAAAGVVRERLCQRIAALLPPGTLLCLPSAPGIAPAIGMPAAPMEAFRAAAMRILCIAGLSGVPQVSIPVTQLDGCPLGLSLMMGAGADHTLLDFIVDHDLRDPPGAADGVNLPQVLAEVQAAFARYEQALTLNQVGVLDQLFWDSPSTVRYGAAENLIGSAQIRAFRAARPAAGLMRTLQHTVITTFGQDCATACTEFTRQGNPRIGRQTQTWVRRPEGWKVVAAHVSVIDPP